MAMTEDYRNEIMVLVRNRATIINGLAAAIKAQRIKPSDPIFKYATDIVRTTEMLLNDLQTKLGLDQ